MVKRYSANILLSKECLQPNVVNMLKKATNDLKNRKYHRNARLKNRFGDIKTQVVWLFVYLSIEDVQQANWICRSQWIDQDLDSKSSPTKLDGKDIGENITIVWNQNYESNSKFWDLHRLNKEDYLESMENILKPMEILISKMLLLREKYEERNVSKENYLHSMSRIEPSVTELYFAAADIGLPPVECVDLNQIFQNILAFAQNIAMLFNENQLRNRDENNRNYLVDFNVKNLQEEIKKLRYEYEKIQ